MRKRMFVVLYVGLMSVVNAQCLSTNLLFSKLFFLSLWVKYINNCFMTGVTASPASSTVTALNNVTLTCTPSSGGIDGYSWHRVDGDLPSQSSGQNTNTLTIHRIVPADEGEYYCMATQFVRHCAVSDNVMVIVEGKSHTVPYSRTVWQVESLAYSCSPQWI